MQNGKWIENLHLQPHPRLHLIPPHKSSITATNSGVVGVAVVVVVVVVVAAVVAEGRLGKERRSRCNYQETNARTVRW
jgi:hypothetical protein